MSISPPNGPRGYFRFWRRCSNKHTAAHAATFSDSTCPACGTTTRWLANAELIAGDDHGHSHALLGIFDAIAPAASAAMTALAKGDTALFHDILAPTVPLSRHIFAAPTRFYKTGVVFMAYLNGMQDHFTMIGGQQSTRSLPHLAQLFRLADQAGLLRQPDLAVTRMRHVLALHGVHDA